MSNDQTIVMQGLIDRIQRGDEAARRELIDRAYERLHDLSAVILRKSFPRMKQAPALLDTTDVANESACRLYRALAEVQPATVRDFFRLAAQRIRWLLLDLAKHEDRPLRVDPVDWPHDQYWVDNDLADPPAVLETLYRQIELLPENEREVVDLLYFHGLSQAEAAVHLEVSERTVRRYWTVARVRLFEALREIRPQGVGLVVIE
jgi:RNA polymerase sigma factor (TIGR02999 family)